MNVFEKTLRRTHDRLAGALRRVLPGGDPETADLEALEEALIAADVGVETATELVEAVRDADSGEAAPRERLRAAMLEVLRRAADDDVVPRRSPWVCLVVGVNGSGKTTTAAKLAARHERQGRSVVLGASDTFRAAAIDQLQTWGERMDVPVVAHRPGGDPAAVAFDTCDSATARGVDVVLIDTAGRLHTKSNLMAELEKIRRVTGKVVEGAPHEVLLVLDATTGQNGLRQAEEFLGHAGVTGIVLAKLDGTAKGGVALTIARRLRLPIRYVGTGERLEDLEPFVPEAYVDALLGGGSPT